MQRSPVIYLAFANHSTNPLPNLEREGRVLLQTLAPREQAGDFNVHRDELEIAFEKCSKHANGKSNIHFEQNSHALLVAFLDEQTVGENNRRACGTLVPDPAFKQHHWNSGRWPNGLGQLL
jgi:hypothetical protein